MSRGLRLSSLAAPPRRIIKPGTPFRLCCNVLLPEGATMTRNSFYVATGGRRACKSLSVLHTNLSGPVCGVFFSEDWEAKQATR